MDLPRDLDLPRDRDGGQAETPFRLDGEPVTSDHPDWDWYAEPIVAYPDAAACLPPAAITDTRLDVAAFQWDTRRSLDETQVCVFRLAHLLGDWRHVAAWFAQSGLRDPEPGRTRPSYQMVSDGSAVGLSGCIGRGTGPDTNVLSPMRGAVMALSGVMDLDISVTYGIDGTLQSVRVAECF